MLDAFLQSQKAKKVFALLFFMVALRWVIGMPCYYARPTYTTTANSGFRTFNQHTKKGKNLLCSIEKV